MLNHTESAHASTPLTFFSVPCSETHECSTAPRPDTHPVEQAKAIVLAAQFLYHITVTYHPLDDGTYEVLPVGDNDFTTIAGASHLSDAILGQISAFMESPAFIAQQIARLTVM